MSKLIAEFVAAPWSEMSGRNSANIKRAIEHAVGHGYASSASELARQAGLTASTLTTLQKEGRTASLEALARLAAATRVALAGLLDDAMWQEFPERRPPDRLAARPRLRVKRSLDWVQIKRNVEAAMARGEISSLHRLSRQLGVDHSFLGEKIGMDTRRQIVEAAARVRKERAAAGFEELCRQIREASVALRQTGAQPSARAIGARIGVNESTPRFRRALEKVRQEAPPE